MTPAEAARRWRELSIASARRDVELATFPTTGASRSKNAAPMQPSSRSKTQRPASKLSTPTVKTTSYVLTLSDLNRTVVMDLSSAGFLTVPTDTNATFPVGSTIPIVRSGTGSTTVVIQFGGTLNSVNSWRQLPQWGVAWVWKQAANSWVLYGDLQA